MILKPGTKVLLSHRRLFASDQPRFFLGIIEDCEDGLARVTGRTWIRNEDGSMHGKEDVRTKVVSFASGTLLVYQLPVGLVLDDLRMVPEDGFLFLRDGHTFEMDLSEGLPSAGRHLSEHRKSA